MKRKNWSHDDPRGELRGKDEWQRISWDEALDEISDGLKRAIDKYGPKSIWTRHNDCNNSNYDDNRHLLSSLGAIDNALGTVSMGSWMAPESAMLGTYAASPDFYTWAETKLHVMFGFNHGATKLGSTIWQLNHAKDKGAKFIVIDPWFNQSAQAYADQWIPILPGTDTALGLAIAHTWLKDNTYDQDYLDKYCIGFDADHMPEGADPKDNFKDYVLGTYDDEPKTAEWAAAITHVPADTITELAREIAKEDKVGWFAGTSTSKIPAGEMWCQVFYTLALMHGGIGTEGSYATWSGIADSIGSSYTSEGNIMTGGGVIPEKAWFSIPSVPVITAWSYDMEKLKDPAAWKTEWPEYSEFWESINRGWYGRDNWPGGKRKLDVHVLAFEGTLNPLNSMPNVNEGIKAVRNMDFVYGMDPFFTPSMQYCDVVLPLSTRWEQGDFAWKWGGDALQYNTHVFDPLYESRSEWEVSQELAKRLGVDMSKVDPMTAADRTYASVGGAKALVDASAFKTSPLVTLTEDDLKEIGVEGGKPQQGLISFKEFKEKGIYKAKHEKGDALTNIPFSAYYNDPEGHPLRTESGKFEIYSSKLAKQVNDMGYSQISPIGKWQFSSEQGSGAQTDEYPLLMWTPHIASRAHGVFYSCPNLREAYPQACHINAIDAEERGIKEGDTVLMTSPYGKVLRYAHVTDYVVPGAVSLQDGAYFDIDEETGIDLGGNPNVLQGFKASGASVQAWTGTLVQVEKYDGPLEIPADKFKTMKTPAGID